MGLVKRDPPWQIGMVFSDTLEAQARQAAEKALDQTGKDIKALILHTDRAEWQGEEFVWKWHSRNLALTYIVEGRTTATYDLNANRVTINVFVDQSEGMDLSD